MQPIIPTNSSWSRVNLTGFVDPCNGRIIVNTMGKGTSQNFIKQLTLLFEEYKTKTKITLYVDNARWHKTQTVKEWVKNHPSISLEFLPKYAPELNPIERHWWYLRKTTTKNVLFQTIEQCWQAINSHFAELTPEKK